MKDSNTKEASEVEMSDNGNLVTLALFAYNQEQFIAEAVRGALAQTYSPLEIILSDDCSTDRTFEIIQQEVSGYTGPHKIRLNRNEQNIGFGAHINRMMEMARGRLIVAAAGDDISLPERVKLLFSAYEASGRKAMSIYSNAMILNEKGKVEGRLLATPAPEHHSLAWMSERISGLLGCSHAWDRRVFDLFGPIHIGVINEDMVIPFRSAIIGEIKFIDESLVMYRRHGNNMQFRGSRDIQGPRALRSDFLKNVDSNIAIYKNRLEDLETICKLFPEKRESLLDCTRVTRRVLREMMDEKALALESKFFKRAGIIRRAVRNGTPLRRAARWVLTFFFPRLYLTYVNHLKVKAH